MTRSRIALLSLGALALAAAGCQRHGSEAHEETPPLPPRAAPLLTLRMEETQDVALASGTVRARLNATLGSKVMARVSGVWAVEGDSVRQGAPLIDLDSRDLTAAVQMASANLRSAQTGVTNAVTAQSMEVRSSQARVQQAEAQLVAAKAGLGVARSRLELALAGPRRQERTQASLAVKQAESSMNLASTELERTKRLVAAGAIPGRQQDVAQNAFDLAKAQYDIAVESERIATEGSRAEDVQAAREAVSQAEAGIKLSEAGVAQARAAALQVRMRGEEVRAARAGVAVAEASVQSAQVMLSYGKVVAPFEGRIVRRMADPGTLAAPGLPLMEIEGGGLRLEAAVPESLVRSIALGKDVPVRFETLSGSIRGRVVEVAPQGDAATHTFLVRISLPENAPIKSGMFGRAEFATGKRSRLLVPAEATWNRDGIEYVLAVNPEGIARLRIVTLGRRFDGRTEVLSGLSAGDRIVAMGGSAIPDGSPIEGAR